MRSEKITVRNPNHPGKTEQVDAGKYRAMEAAMLAVIPVEAPGLTVAALKGPVVARLPESLFPGGATAGWWLKLVQLDLEARGEIRRSAGSPLRLHRT
ncbi:hypothetical protein RCO27_11425 [Sphingosinicella sp. LHD-64]|uniref:DUF6958 family protein n=1 Tax=Sphingosinicella sp. LHD-64 TaxID=3072139 RepID=UPI00280FC327|nr:hypothetical protein [Sphingosinicella sp. LHD-64]MDQ8756837.1 hypothetical protein [Sphingosinicella sp. LHD-64]